MSKSQGRLTVVLRERFDRGLDRTVLVVRKTVEVDEIVPFPAETLGNLLSDILRDGEVPFPIWSLIYAIIDQFNDDIDESIRVDQDLWAALEALHAATIAAVAQHDRRRRAFWGGAEDGDPDTAGGCQAPTLAAVPDDGDTPAAAVAAELRRLAEARGDDENDLVEALDELVHDVKGHEAAAINNGGLDDQVEYLLAAGVTRDEILGPLQD